MYVCIFFSDQQLQGFIYEEPYFEGITLRIDRSDKITLPDSEITLKGLGLRKVAQPDNNNTTNGNTTNVGNQRDDLTVLFELAPEDEDEKVEAVVGMNGGASIKSQEDLNAYIDKQKSAADVKFGRKFLKLLSQFSNEDDDDHQQ
jgi:hypothetical protein